jgi:hypothetical protein
MLCAESYRDDRRARRVIFSFFKEALRTDISTIKKLQNTDITIRWLNIFLNHLPEKSAALQQSQQALEQIAQTKNDTQLLHVAAAMNTIITTLSKDEKKDGGVEALANAIVNGIRFLGIYQNTLMFLLIADENPIHVITKLRKGIEKLNAMNKKQPFSNCSSIKVKFNPSRKKCSYDRHDRFVTQLVFYSLRTDFFIIDYIEKLTEAFYNKGIANKVGFFLYREKMHLQDQRWWYLLKQYSLFLAEKCQQSTIDYQNSKTEEKLLKCLTEKITSLCNLSSIAGLEQQEEIVQIKIRTIEHMEETIKACTGTIENQEYIIASQEEKITLQNLLITEFESVDIQQKKQQGKISDFIDISTPSRNTKCYDEKDKSTQNHNSSEKNIRNYSA